MGASLARPAPPARPVRQPGLVPAGPGRAAPLVTRAHIGTKTPPITAAPDPARRILHSDAAGMPGIVITVIRQRIPLTTLRDHESQRSDHRDLRDGLRGPPRSLMIMRSRAPSGGQVPPGGRGCAHNVHEKKQSVFIGCHFSGAFPANRNPVSAPLIACSGRPGKVRTNTASFAIWLINAVLSYEILVRLSRHTGFGQPLLTPGPKPWVCVTSPSAFGCSCSS